MDWFNKLIAASLPAVPRPIVGKVSARYIAGEGVEDALAAVRRLNDGGMMATLDVLGEFVATVDEAHAAGREYCELLRAITENGLDSNVSLKLSQMGLTLDPELAHTITREVVETASGLDNFVRIDMEDSPWTTATLEVHRRLAETHPGRVGAVIQAYLRRSAQDVAELSARRANVRLCKGIYVEPEEIAFKDPLEINRSYMQLLRTLLEAGSYVGIATHDERLVHGAMQLIEELGLEKSAYEFQMLLGVREALRNEIVAQGHRLRVYVPYGRHWYAYSVRRLKENPQIAGHVLKGLLGAN